MIRFDINDFEFTKSTSKIPIHTEVYKGSHAIRKYLELIRENPQIDIDEIMSDIYQVDQLRLLLELINNFLTSVKIENISSEDKNYLIYNITYLYKSKIKMHIDYHKAHDEEPRDIIKLSSLIEEKIKH